VKGWAMKNPAAWVAPWSLFPVTHANDFPLPWEARSLPGAGFAFVPRSHSHSQLRAFGNSLSSLIPIADLAST
jgi:hypothetical protein